VPLNIRLSVKCLPDTPALRYELRKGTPINFVILQTTLKPIIIIPIVIHKSEIEPNIKLDPVS